MSLPSFSVSRPIAISMLCLGIMLCGLVALPLLPLELLPSIATQEISVLTRLRGGIASSEVEQCVTIPMEEALGSLSHLAGMESSSKEGESAIYLQFLPNANTDLATLEIQEGLSKVRAKLPPETEPPIVSKFSPDDRPILTYAFFSAPNTPKAGSPSLEDIRQILEHTLKVQLEKIRGVSHVEIVGGREKKIMVNVDTARLRQRGLSWAKVLSTLNSSNVQDTSGQMSQATTTYPVRVMGAIHSAGDLPSLPIASGPGSLPFTLADIASVKEGYLPAESYSRFNGNEVVGLHIYKESAANTLRVAQAVKDALGAAATGLAAKQLAWDETSDQSRFILDALGSVRNSLLVGACLAIGCLLFFLGDLAHVFVVATVLPFSMLGTLFVLFLCGGSLNVMTLAGLALGIGMLTDNTIVVLENIRSKGKQDIQAQRPALLVQATEQMWLPMAASTFTTMISFFPLVFVNKEVQRLYAPLGAVVVGSLLFSLFAAVSLTPMLLRVLPWAGPQKGSRRFTFSMEAISRGYARILLRILRRPFFFLGLTAIVLALSLWGLGKIPKDVLGVFQEHVVLGRINPPVGASLETCNTIMRGLEAQAASLPGMEKYHSLVKRDDLRLTLLLDKKIAGPQTKYFAMDRLREKIHQYQDAFLYFEGGQQEETLKTLDIEMFFDDPLLVPGLLRSVGKTLGNVAELKDLRVRSDPQQPEYHLEVDRRAAAQMGLSTKDISDQVHLQMRGMVPTRLYQGAGELETVTRLDPDKRQDLSSVKGLVLDAPGTNGIPLANLVNFRVSEGSATIWRKNRKRVVQWIGNIQNESLEDVAKKVETSMRKLVLPTGCFWDFGQTYQRFVRTNQELRQAGILVLLLLYLFLTAVFQSFWKPWIIFSAILMSLVGVVLALAISGTPIAPAVGIGFMVLAGIVINNSILLVDRFTKLSSRVSRSGGVLSLRSVLRASSGRLRPILMTSLTTILGFMPMALSHAESSGLWKPLAITLIGGLSSSTLFTLFLTPTLYWVVHNGLRRIGNLATLLPWLCHSA